MGSIYFFKYAIKFFELLAAVAGFITWNKWKNSYWKFFPVYLAIITVCEFVGHFFAVRLMLNAVNNLYAFVIPLEFLFFCWLFYKYLPQKHKWTAITGAGCYILALIIEKITIPGPGYFFKSMSYSVGNIVILLLTVLFFINLFISAEILLFRRNIMFWVSIGLIVFYLGTYPFFALYNYYLKKDRSFLEAYAWAMIFSNYCMYLLFTIGFIWGKSISRSSSSASVLSS
jgi:hypothetical protein